MAVVRLTSDRSAGGIIASRSPPAIPQSFSRQSILALLSHATTHYDSAGPIWARARTLPVHPIGLIADDDVSCPVRLHSHAESVPALRRR